MRGTTNLSLSTILILLLLIVAGSMIKVGAQIDKPITGTTSALAINYPEGPSLSVKFKGTSRLPKSSGEAKVQRKKGSTEIEMEVDEMKPAAFFGGDFATYVLWVVSPEGHTDNVGEFILQGNRSKLNVTTTLETFGLFVTAEPHFLVDVPSHFVVMENTRPTNNLTGKMLETATIKYRGFDGVYRASQETLNSESEVKGETRSDVRQARVALLLAERADAQQFAPEEYAKASESWKKTAEAAEAKVDKKILMTYGHETVRLAVDAEKRAKERSFQAALDSERKTRTDEITSLKTSIEKAQTDAERADLEAKRKAMELAMETAARNTAVKQAEDAARRATEAEEKARLAQLQAGQLATDKAKAQLDAEAAKSDAAKAQQERDAARSRMRDALNQVVETRETARGLIVNLPDILFDFNKDQLKAEAKEKLSKVCGILTVAGGYNLVIEGHTDSKGSDEYNQSLSERRAKNVSTYLGACGLKQDNITSQGFGKTQPIATNDTAEGRQQNRRVEIVISDGTKTSSSSN